VPEDTLRRIVAFASGRTVPAVPIETPVPASAES
jgi:hypothetical protein